MISAMIRDNTDPDYRYVCVKKDNEGKIVKIWGVYCTYIHWNFNIDSKYVSINDALIFSWSIDKPIRFTFSTQTYSKALCAYRYRKINDGYVKLDGDEFANNHEYDHIHDAVSKKIFWKTLSK